MSALLEEVTSRLRQGLAVEMVRERDGWQVVDAARPLTLPECRTVFGEYEVYRAEHIAHRPGGDLDVVVSATPYDHQPRAYIAFRLAGVWRPLVGRWSDIETAITAAEHATRFAGWDNAELAALLNTLEASS